MQRIFAILLLALFSFSLLAPVVSAQDAEAKLPPCCRRDGKHGCGMKMKTTAASTGVAWRTNSRCSMFGKAGVTPAMSKAIVAAPAETLAVSLVSHPSAVEQVEARYRVSFSRSKQKRGPPSFLS